MEQRQQVREPPPAAAPGALPVGAARQRRVASPQPPAPSGGALARPNASSPRPPGVPASTAIVAGMPAMRGGRRGTGEERGGTVRGASKTSSIMCSVVVRPVRCPGLLPERPGSHPNGIPFLQPVADTEGGCRR